MIMSGAQLEICYDAPVKVPPAASVEDVEWLVDLLKRYAHLDKTSKGWMKAPHLAEASQGYMNERKVRKVARAARPVVVSYPGSPGYKLWDDCTVEEINHAINAFDSQAKDMTACAHTYRMAYHRRFRGGAQ